MPKKVTFSEDVNHPAFGFKADVVYGPFDDEFADELVANYGAV